MNRAGIFILSAAVLLPFSGAFADENPPGDSGSGSGQSNRNKNRSYVEIFAGHIAGTVSSENMEPVLRDGISDPMRIGFFTMRYGSSAEILRNYLAGKMINPPSLYDSHSFELRYGVNTPSGFHVGAGIRNAEFLIRNAPVNASSSFIRLNEDLYVLGMLFLEIPNPAFRDLAMNCEFYDRLLVKTGYALRTVTANIHAGYYFLDRGPYHPYIRIMYGMGVEKERSIRAMESGIITGIKYSISDRTSLQAEMIYIQTSFFGAHDGIYSAGSLSQSQIQMGMGYEF